MPNLPDCIDAHPQSSALRVARKHVANTSTLHIQKHRGSLAANVKNNLRAKGVLGGPQFSADPTRDDYRPPR